MLDDGLDALRAEIGTAEIASLVERTVRWAAAETFNFLPIWYPEYARRRSLYNADWSEPRMIRNRTSGRSTHKVEGNMSANEGLTRALGLRKKSRPNWSCCHLWGIDDDKFQKSNAVVSDHRFFSCIGNMVLLPTPLKAFTDAMPEIKAMLRLCARNLYGWQCDHESMVETNKALDLWADWSAWPSSWPRIPGEKLPAGTVPFTEAIRKDAEQRLATVRRDLREGGEFYPREEVKEAFAYWKISESAEG